MLDTISTNFFPQAALRKRKQTASGNPPNSVRQGRKTHSHRARCLAGSKHTSLLSGNAQTQLSHRAWGLVCQPYILTQASSSQGQVPLLGASPSASGPVSAPAPRRPASATSQGITCDVSWGASLLSIPGSHAGEEWGSNFALLNLVSLKLSYEVALWQSLLATHASHTHAD